MRSLGLVWVALVCACSAPVPTMSAAEVEAESRRWLRSTSTTAPSLAAPTQGSSLAVTTAPPPNVATATRAPRAGGAEPALQSFEDLVRGEGLPKLRVGTGVIAGRVEGVSTFGRATVDIRTRPGWLFLVRPQLTTRDVFSFDGLPPGEYRLVAWTSDEFAKAYVTVGGATETQTIRLTLRPRGTVRGSVRIEGGGSVSRLRIFVDPDSEVSRRSVIRANGQYTLSDVAPGRTRLSLGIPEGLGLCGASVYVDVPSGGEVEVRSLVTRWARWSQDPSGIVTRGLANRTGMTFDHGEDNITRVFRVEPGSGAARAGIEVGDEVVALDDVPLDGVDANCLARGVALGETLRVRLRGQQQPVRVVAR